MSEPSGPLSHVVDSEIVRCAEWAREQEVEMAGTATPQRGYLLLEWPQPWPADVASVPELSGLSMRLNERGIRLQLIRAVGREIEIPVAILYLAPAGEWFREYDRCEVRAPQGQLLRAVDEMLEEAEPSLWEQDHLADLLICTHGARDVCCGSAGTQLVQAVARDRLIAESGIRVWRTSHTGGHRFAPTAIHLPSGTVWGRLTLADVVGIVAHTGEAAEFADLLRGCSGLSDPRAQLLDRVALQTIGWDWMRYSKRDACAPDGQVRLFGVSPLGADVAWEAHIVPGRTLPVPVCRAPISSARKTERELTLASYRMLV